MPNGDFGDGKAFVTIDNSGDNNFGAGWLDSIAVGKGGTFGDALDGFTSTISGLIGCGEAVNGTIANSISAPVTLQAFGGKGMNSIMAEGAFGR